MVDIDTIKPGDRVAFRVSPTSRAPAIFLNTEVRVEVFSGEEFVVGDPPITDDGRYVRVMHHAFSTGHIELAPEQCDLNSSPAHLSCTCDIMSLMRVGCKCGYMA